MRFQFHLSQHFLHMQIPSSYLSWKSTETVPNDSTLFGIKSGKSETFCTCLESKKRETKGGWACQVSSELASVSRRFFYQEGTVRFLNQAS